MTWANLCVTIIIKEILETDSRAVFGSRAQKSMGKGIEAESPDSEVSAERQSMCLTWKGQVTEQGGLVSGLGVLVLSSGCLRPYRLWVFRSGQLCYSILHMDCRTGMMIPICQRWHFQEGRECSSDGGCLPSTWEALGSITRTNHHHNRIHEPTKTSLKHEGQEGSSDAHVCVGVFGYVQAHALCF